MLSLCVVTSPSWRQLTLSLQGLLIMRSVSDGETRRRPRDLLFWTFDQLEVHRSEDTDVLHGTSWWCFLTILFWVLPKVAPPNVTTRPCNDSWLTQILQYVFMCLRVFMCARAYACNYVGKESVIWVPYRIFLLFIYSPYISRCCLEEALYSDSECVNNISGRNRTEGY